jgi:hypothetical protein
MTVLHPALLWALPLAATPILIYYLMRFRSLQVAWGATYVLERALERLRKQFYLDQIILLALRTLAVAALVVAFARPLSRERAARVTGSGVHRLVVVDVSYSMAAGGPEEGCWARGRAVLDELVGRWGRGERWSLCAAGAEPQWLLRDAVVATPEESRAALDRLSLREERAALAAALGEACDAARAGPAEIYLLADDQAASWSGVAETLAARPAGTPVYWIRPPLPTRQNLAVTRLRPAAETALAGEPLPVYATVRNYGPEAVRDAPLELLLDGAFRGRAAVSLLPAQEQTVRLDLTVEAAGSHGVEVRLGGDALAWDDAAAAGLEVRERLRVAVLRQAGREEKFASAYPFLRLAAESLRRTRQAAPLWEVREITGPLADGALAATDVVILDSARPVTAELAARLEAFVAGGGGLLMAVDESVDRAAWNRHLGGADLLPARLGPARAEPLGEESGRTLGAAGFGPPALRALGTSLARVAETLVFYAWVELRDEAAEAEVLAAFGDGSPFAVRRRRPLGATLLLASGLNGRTNNLIVREAYYPLVSALLLAAAEGACYPRVVAPGEPIRLRLVGEEGGGGAAWRLGEGEAVALPVRTTPHGREVLHPGGAARSGLGSVLVLGEGAPRRVWFGVQAARMDSDLTPLDPAADAALEEIPGLIVVADWPALEEILAAARRGEEWHPWAVLLILACLLGEKLMERRFL